LEDNFSKSLFLYLDAKIDITLQYSTTSIMSPYTSSISSTGSTSSTGSITINNTSTGSTSSTGIIIEKVKDDKITKEQYAKLVDGTYFLLANNANFSFIEYSDLECRYCAKLHTD
jgi:hypothetical protein